MRQLFSSIPGQVLDFMVDVLALVTRGINLPLQKKILQSTGFPEVQNS